MQLLNKQISNRYITQVLLIAILLLLIISSIAGLKYFIPGFLGAITLYILFRNYYQKLTEQRGWKKSYASLFFIVLSLISVALPLYLLVNYMVPQAKGVFENRDLILQRFEQVKAFMATKPILRNIDLSGDGISNYLQKGVSYIPKLLGSVAALLTNLIVALFVLYFMQVNNKLMEKRIQLSLPFSQRSKKLLWSDVELMVRSNAIGIPVMAFCQGIVAWIGYWIFGVKNPLLWGMITGAATIIPVVGTMVIWLPLTIVVMATVNVMNGVWLSLYCLIIVGGVDNVLRFTILRRLGDVPPLITVFGVILGLNIFGMLGLIFGPLMLSLISVLFDVYRNEYGRRNELSAQIALKKQEAALKAAEDANTSNT